MEYQDACGTAARAAEFADFAGKRSLFVTWLHLKVGALCVTN